MALDDPTRGGDTRLLTRDGHYVTTVCVPPFNPPTEIINWGDRFFVRNSGGEYREGMMWPSTERAR